MTEPRDPIRVLFVCMGNICRSPMAEGVFRHLVRQAGLEDRFEIDSAGIGDWHEGEAPDARATAAAAARGVRLTGSARQVQPLDLQNFDYVLAMDAENLSALYRLAGRGPRRIVGVAAAEPEGREDGDGLADVRLLREFERRDGEERVGGVRADLDVPDPYYGGPAGFDRVYEMVERSARGLLETLREEHGL